MIEFLRNWVFNIAALAIFIVIIEILIPSGKTRKYVSLVSGFILIITIINPFLGLFNKGINLKEFQISNSNLLDKNEIQKDSKVLSDRQMKQITEVYREKIISQLKESASSIEGISEVKADAIINEDYTSDSFGEIKRVYLNLSFVDDKDSTKAIKKIEEIEKVEKIQIEEKQQEEKQVKKGSDIDVKIKNKLEDRVNKLLGVDKANIVITVEG